MIGGISMNITYNPSMVPAFDLPVYYRAVRQYSHLWNRLDAQTFCRALCGLATVTTISPAEYTSIAIVASGGIWPVPDSVYTHEDWARDESFAAVPGQEITEDIYDEMFNCMPPLTLPRCERTRQFSAGFMMGEPNGTEPRTFKTMYLAFGKADNRYYFIGSLPARATR